MSDMHYYGCCACIGSAGLGLAGKMALLTTEKGFAVNLYLDGSIRSKTPSGTEVVIRTETDYPVSGLIRIYPEPDKDEQFELKIRIPEWSKCTKLSVNGDNMDAAPGYVCINRVWKKQDMIVLQLDMRTEVLYPIPYGHELLMNNVVWSADYMVATYDEEDPLAKYHIALRRGPVILAQENRLGYSVDEPVEIDIKEDGYVETVFPKKEIAPYDHLLELEVPLKNGSTMHVTDYSSAGKLWTEESKMADWMLTVNHVNGK